MTPSASDDESSLRRQDTMAALEAGREHMRSRSMSRSNSREDFERFRQRRSQRASMCVDDSVSHDGETTRALVEKLKTPGAKPSSDPALPKEGGIRKRGSKRDSRDRKAAKLHSPSKFKKAAVQARNKAKQRRKRRCNWRSPFVWAPFAGILVLALVIFIYKVWKGRDEAMIKAKDRSITAPESRSDKLASGTMLGFVDAIDCGRPVNIITSGRGNKYWPAAKTSFTEAGGILIEVVNPTGRHSSNPELEKVIYQNSMGAFVTMSFAEWGDMVPQIKVLSSDEYTSQYEVDMDAEQPPNWKEFLKVSVGLRRSSRILLDKIEFNKKSIRSKGVEVIFEENPDGMVYGKVNLSTPSLKMRHGSLNITDFNKRIKGVTWEDHHDNFGANLKRDTLHNTNNLFKHHIKFELVKDPQSWAKHIIWHIKMRNTGDSQNAHANDGVNHIKAYQGPGKWKDITSIQKRLRKDGSEYILLTINNEKHEGTVDTYKSIRMRTGKKCNAGTAEAILTFGIKKGGGAWDNWRTLNYDIGIAGNQDIILRFKNDMFDGKDKNVKQIEALINQRNYSVNLVVRMPGMGTDGNQDFEKLRCMRIDLEEEGTVKYKPWTWGKDRKIGMVVCAETLPEDMCEDELQDRLEALEFNNKHWALGTDTLEKRMRFMFVRSLTEFMDKKWKGGLKEGLGLGRKIAWGAAGTLAVAGAAVYGVHKMTPGGLGVINTITGQGSE